jgi:BirA family biotin operon repressor/biotin-[acetyl-CoA-carboxylase] ligase
MLSLVVRSRLPAARAALIALAAAVGVADAIGPEAAIKWPNDVLDPQGRKLAGILAELESQAPVVAILGIGVNAGAAPDLPTAGALGEIDRAALAARLVDRVLAAVAVLETTPADLLDRWRRRAAFLGREVEVAGRRGRMLDIDEDGALLLAAPEGRIRILAGDVALVGGSR